MARQYALTLDFVTRIKAVRNAPVEKLDKLLRVIGSDVGQALVERTPVDTGNARGHWYATIGEEDQANPSPPAVDAKGEVIGSPESLAGDALAQMGIVAATAHIGDTVSFNNDAAYIEELENGHSQQAPNGMVATVAQDFDQMCMDAAVRIGIVEGVT